MFWCSLLCRSPPAAEIFTPASRPQTFPGPAASCRMNSRTRSPPRKQTPISTACANGNWPANVKFVPHTNRDALDSFHLQHQLLDYVSGGTYNPQVVTVSSLSRAQVCHEMGHSFGFTHENIRPDATNYITVLTNNITDESSNIVFFTIDPTSVTNGNYDFESVMHLGWDFDSTNPGVLPRNSPSRRIFRATNTAWAIIV